MTQAHVALHRGDPIGAGYSPPEPGLSLNEPLLTATDAAALLFVRPSWIYEAVRDGRFPCIRVGRHIRFTRAVLEMWLGAQR